MPEIIVIAHDVRSTHNVGSLFRTCEGMGIEKIYLTGYTPYPKSKSDPRLPHLSDKIDRQIHKTGLGAEKLVNWDHSSDIAKAIERLKSDGYVIAALEQSKNSIPINKYKPPKKIALILGNELNGLDQETLNLCDEILEIPMFGKKESFNVVNAAAIALYKLRFSD